jgi:AraC-like DNA-binding protein
VFARAKSRCAHGEISGPWNAECFDSQEVIFFLREPNRAARATNGSMVSSSAQSVVIPAESTVSNRVLLGIIEAVEEAGVPRSQLLRAAQLDAELLELPDARVPRSQVFRLCELAIGLTGDTGLGLHWGERLTGNTFNPLSHLIFHAATLRQGIESLSQFHRLLTDQLSYEVSEGDGKVTVRRMRVPGEALGAQRFAAEMLVTGFYRLLRSFCVNARPERVSFEYAAPSYRAEYARVFGGAERFDQLFTGIVFDSRLMNVASPHNDEDVHGALRSIAERRILRLTQRTPYAVRVREVLVQQGPACDADMEGVARCLGLSVRSLRRRLAAEGKTYNALANDALGIIARHLLLEKRCTIQEAAYEMGFLETSTFHRAFKRWTGMTPQEYRSR